MILDPPQNAAPNQEQAHGSARLPNNADAERALLGAAMLDNNVLPAVMGFLKPEDFYQPVNQIIYRRMIELIGDGKTVELTVLSDLLRKNNELASVGNYVYLANLEQFVISTSAAPEHARLVQEKAIFRRLIRAAEIIREESITEQRDVLEQVEVAQRLVFEVLGATQDRGLVGSQHVTEATVAEVFERAELARAGGMIGVGTGISDFDRIMGGLRVGDLATLAAGTSIGKTSFALSVARFLAVEHQIPVAYFGMEMGREENMERVICAQGMLSFDRARKGIMTDDELSVFSRAAGVIHGAPLSLSFSPGLTVAELAAQGRVAKTIYPGLKLLIVDSLSLMDLQMARGENQAQSVGRATRRIKQLAGELGLAILMLHQINRNVDRAGRSQTRGGRLHSGRPSLSDLRDSGNVEQDSSQVWFLHRRRVELDPSATPDEAPPVIPTEIILAKNRNGPTGTAIVGFHVECQRWLALDRAEQMAYRQAEGIDYNRGDAGNNKSARGRKQTNEEELPWWNDRD